MRQVDYSLVLCRNAWVYSPTAGGPTAFSIPLRIVPDRHGKAGMGMLRVRARPGRHDEDGFEALRARIATPVIRRPPERQTFATVCSRPTYATCTESVKPLLGRRR